MPVACIVTAAKIIFCKLFSYQVQREGFKEERSSLEGFLMPVKYRFVLFADLLGPNHRLFVCEPRLSSLLANRIDPDRKE